MIPCVVFNRKFGFRCKGGCNVLSGVKYHALDKRTLKKDSENPKDRNGGEDVSILQELGLPCVKDAPRRQDLDNHDLNFNKAKDFGALYGSGDEIEAGLNEMQAIDRESLTMNGIFRDEGCYRFVPYIANRKRTGKTPRSGR